MSLVKGPRYPCRIIIEINITEKYFKRRGESRSPMSDRRRHQGDREEPEPNKCLGVFGLSLYTTERELEKEFGRFGASAFWAPFGSVLAEFSGNTRRFLPRTVLGYETSASEQQLRAEHFAWSDWRARIVATGSS